MFVSFIIVHANHKITCGNANIFSTATTEITAEMYCSQCVILPNTYYSHWVGGCASGLTLMAIANALQGKYYVLAAHAENCHSDFPTRFGDSTRCIFIFFFSPRTTPISFRYFTVVIVIGQWPLMMCSRAQTRPCVSELMTFACTLFTFGILHMGVHRKPYDPYDALWTHTSSRQNQIKFKMHHKIQYVSRKRDKLINADFSAPSQSAHALKVARASHPTHLQINSNGMLLFSFCQSCLFFQCFHARRACTCIFH